MKKLIAVVALGLTVPAFADANSTTSATVENIIGVVRVDSSYARTIVSVPWLGTDGNNVKVADLVKTDNLTIGDTLNYYNVTEKKYECWVLTESSGTTNWTATTIVSDSDVYVGATSDRALPRGGAIVLIRQNPTAGHFFLQGLYATSTDTTTITAGSGTAAYTLIAPSTASNDGVALNDATWSNVDASDQLMIELGGGQRCTCVRKDGVWKQVEYETENDLTKKTYSTPPTITAGTGIWYISYGSATPSVTW